jgi:hypothetical protein
MKAIIKVVLWLLGVVFILYLAGFFLPNTAYVERSARIHASPASIYKLLNNLETYDGWMPWNQLDPKWKVEYGPQKAGTGAWYQWHSDNKEVGAGKLTIEKSVPNEMVITKMEFEGFKEPATGGWVIKAMGDSTELRWYMNSQMGNNPAYRWMGLFMDKMIGGKFEKGLASIERIVDSSSRAK